MPVPTHQQYGTTHQSSTMAKELRSLHQNYTLSSTSSCSSSSTQQPQSCSQQTEAGKVLRKVSAPAEIRKSLPVDENHSLVRSESQDRFWNEAVQFYETVGEPAAPEIIDSTDDDSSCSEDENQKPQPQQQERPKRCSFAHLLPPQQATSCPFVYRGIESNPPEITKRGVNRGNPAQIHRKAWLEVSDSKHRYGKNLRLYYRHWESLGFPTNNFFDWLDSKGLAEGNPLPSIEECPREVLDNDTVLYITDPEVTSRYALEFRSQVDGRCRVLDSKQDYVATGPEGYIFVIRDGVFYGAEKVNTIRGDGTQQRFHHSSFFGGKAVAAAGIFITDDDGYLTLLYPHSGHYRPGEADLQTALLFLHEHGIDLSTFHVDTQQLIRVNRKDSSNKKKKVESLHLKRADSVAHFLSHKARSQLWLTNIGRFV
jgi:hypothetical protein